MFTGGVWTIMQDYSSLATWTWDTTNVAPGQYSFQVHVRSTGSTSQAEAFQGAVYQIATAVITTPASGASLSATPPSPQVSGTQVTFVAAASGGSGTYEYKFWMFTGGVWTVMQDYSSLATWTWDTTSVVPGQYAFQVHVRNAGSASLAEASQGAVYVVTSPAATVSLGATPTGPQPAGTSVTFTAAATPVPGTYEYRFWMFTGGIWTIVQDYSTLATWTWNTANLAAGQYSFQVHARRLGSSSEAEAFVGAVYEIGP
jgi:hypothetical protein